MNKVVVTGIGLVTALGFGREKTWRAVLAGQSGIKPDALNGGHLCARLADFEPPAATRLLSMAFLAAAEAMQDSRIDIAEIGAERVGCTVSVSKPNLASGVGEALRVSDIFMPETLGRQLSQIFKLRGPLRNVVAACASGTNSVIMGAEWIRHGICDAVITGAVESSLHPLYQAAFRQMGVLAARHVRPFDKNREGFALGEGAGILVLERKDMAMLRGAPVYGEIAGSAMANDAGHPVAFNLSGDVIARAIATALTKAELDTVDYINAHGTGTKLNDVIETRAIKKALGSRAYDVSVSSTKAATGHLLGASGAVECAFALLALRDGVVPPTLNLYEPDGECDLDYTPHCARGKNMRTAMSLSFGFGGQIGVIVVSR